MQDKQRRRIPPVLGACLWLAYSASVSAGGLDEHVEPKQGRHVDHGAAPAAPKPTAIPAAQAESGKPPAQAETGKGKPVAEYRPRRWSLSPGGSQRRDWLTGKDRFDWPPKFNAKKTLGLPDWLNASLEYRVRYETLDVPFVKGQVGSQYQVPMQTVLFMEAHHESLRAGFEFWDARQFQSREDASLNNTMVDVASFTEMYAAWDSPDLAGSGLGFEAKGGIQTFDLGSRRLVARNAFRATTNAFTGVSFRLRDGGGDWEARVFATQPVVRLPDQKADLVDNGYAWNPNQEDTVFTGAFGTFKLPYDFAGELYLYYLGEPDTSTNNRSLFTPGLRIHRPPKKGEFDFEGESIAQTGTRNDTIYGAGGKGVKQEVDVEAFYQHVQAGYTFDAPFEPRVLVQYDWASGGADPGTSHSFDTLYGARRWEYGPTGIFGPFARNNINSPGARLFVVPHRDVGSFVAYRAWWMADRRGLWQPANLIDPTGKSGDFMGHTVEVSTRWDAHENLALEAGWAYLIKGGFARNAPGAPANHDNSNYFYVQTLLRF